MNDITWEIPRETTEWIGPVTVSPSGLSVQLAILPVGQRPTETDWDDPVVLDGAPGLLLTTPTVGTYAYWAKVADTPETVVIEAFALIRVT